MAGVPMDDINEHYTLLDLEPLKRFKPPIVFIIGGPGAGKASLCFKFRAKYGITYISLGNLLRREADLPTARGREVAKYVHQLPSPKVPLDLVMDVMKSELARSCNAQRPIFVQGFPRDVEQAVRYEEEIMPIRHSFFINTSEAYSKKHLLQRNMYAARFEDSEAIIHKRRQAFRRDALPLLENLARKHRVIEVDGNKGDASVFHEADEVFQYWLWQLKLDISPIKKPKQAEETEEEIKQRRIESFRSVAELAVEKSFPSVHYSGPTYNGHV